MKINWSHVVSTLAAMVIFTVVIKLVIKQKVNESGKITDEYFGFKQNVA